MITTSPLQDDEDATVPVICPEPTAIAQGTLGIVQVAVTVAEASLTSPALEPKVLKP
jgi:hypothetical protein